MRPTIDDVIADFEHWHQAGRVLGGRSVTLPREEHVEAAIYILRGVRESTVAVVPGKRFLLCPVRNATAEEHTAVERYVEDLEATGVEVHWPTRDTDQDDPIGLRICQDNIRAIRSSEQVDIWWSPSTRGGVFDLGVALALHKPIAVVHPVVPTAEKSFENVVLELG